MRIRTPFAAAFLSLCLLAAYLGLSNLRIPANDKFLRFVTFFVLTLCFYWILDATRRRVVNFTLGICTLLGGIGSEFVQNIISNRAFDPLNIVANLAGSGTALALCTWYHRRMLERKRLAKSYQAVAVDEMEFDQDGEELHDIEAARATSLTLPPQEAEEDKD